MTVPRSANDHAASNHLLPSTSNQERIAAIDVGSNSIKLTIARRDAEGEIVEVVWDSETVRLGAGLEKAGRLADDRIDAALATLGRFAATARDHGAAAIVAVATEATRSAANGAAFLARVQRETGIAVRVIDGDQEADLTFRGLAATTDVSGDLVVADVGGGSTELIIAAGGQVRGARSLPLGSGRLTDRLVAADPPSASELAACRRAAADLIATFGPDLPLSADGNVRLIVVGGTGEYLGRLVPDEHWIEPPFVDAVLDRLTRIESPDLAELLDVAAARARVLPAGVAIVAAVADRITPARIEVARSGIRRGLLIDEFARTAAEHSRRRDAGLLIETRER